MRRPRPAHYASRARGELRADLHPELVTDLLLGPLYYRLFLSGEPLGPGSAEQLVSTLRPEFAAPWSSLADCRRDCPDVIRLCSVEAIRLRERPWSVDSALKAGKERPCPAQLRKRASALVRMWSG